MSIFFETAYNPEKAENAISFLDYWSTMIADIIEFFKAFWEKIQGVTL